MSNRDAVALVSSIQSGWNQWSCGIFPYEQFVDVTSVVHLRVIMSCCESLQRVCNRGALFKIFREIFFVEEHIWILEFLIEPILHLLEALHHS